MIRSPRSVITHQARLVSSEFSKNSCFDLNSSSNRDDGLRPLVLLKERFLFNGVELNTSDIETHAQPAFELHFNICSATSTAPRYLLLLETPLIHPKNGDQKLLSEYERIFTWNDDLVDDKRFIKLNFPNQITVPNVNGFGERDRFCCIISGNKATVISNYRELYSERIRAIRWFEQNTHQEFDLYGIGWNTPPAKRGFAGKIQRHFWRNFAPILPIKPFPSYRGKIASKHDVLTCTRFAICYENVSEMPGYITEKIFDCFFAGCVPVYWGASNIGDHIPTGCFIDRREFKDTKAVYQHLKAMSENTYRAYQQCIANFLSSEAAHPFSAEAFANTIVTTIVKDLDPSS